MNFIKINLVFLRVTLLRTVYFAEAPFRTRKSRVELLKPLSVVENVNTKVFFPRFFILLIFLITFNPDAYVPPALIVGRKGKWNFKRREFLLIKDDVEQ